MRMRVGTQFYSANHDDPPILIYVTNTDGGFPSNKIHQPNVGLMLGQLRRRWPNIKPALVRCLVFAEELLRFENHEPRWQDTLSKCRSNDFILFYAYVIVVMVGKVRRSYLSTSNHTKSEPLAWFSVEVLMCSAWYDKMGMYKYINLKNYTKYTCYLSVFILYKF